MSNALEVQSEREGILEVIKKVTHAQTSQYFGGEDVELVPAPPEHTLGQVLKRYIVMLLLTGSDIRMTFKVHFNPEQVRSYRVLQGAKPEDLVDKQVIDFMKELCNQIGGRASRVFQSHAIALGMSIPLYSRGIYEIYADYQEKNGLVTKFGDFWGLKGSFGLLYFSCYIEWMDATPFTNLRYTDEHSDEGELDFL